MTSTSRVLPYPFKPVKSFLAVACGEEKIEMKPEWADVLAASASASPTDQRRSAA